MQQKSVKLALAGALCLSLGGAAAFAQTKPKLIPIKVGINSAVDQIGVPVAVEQGFFDKEGLDASLAPAFASGVEALNALQAGAVQFVHVGVPIQGALIAGMDIVVIGDYTGAAARKRSDGTMSLVARKGSGIDGKDLTTVKGKKIASTLGATNHIYVRNLLASAGLKPEDYTLVNTPPPDMPVALSGGAVDAVVAWDPWPIIARFNVADSYEVARGGGHVANVGYMVTTRDFATKNPEIVDRYLAARAQADQWVRKNPDAAAEIATRWIPGVDIKIAKASLANVVPLTDGRLSACSVLGMQEGMDFTREMRKVEKAVDVRAFVRPAAATRLAEKRPELFSDLEAVPAEAKLPNDDITQFDLAIARKVCR